MKKFKKGDWVRVPGYLGLVQLDYIDDLLTSITGKTYWWCVDEFYLSGRSKTITAENYCEDEMIYISPEEKIQIDFENKLMYG